MILHQPQFILNGDTARYSVTVDMLGIARELWFTVDQVYSDMISHTADAALIGLLLPAMLTGEDIYIDAAVSEELVWNVQEPYQCLMMETIPWLSRITITAKETFADITLPDGVSTGFSGGIDSYCTIAEYLSEHVPRHLRLTHLVFANVGSHGAHGEKSVRLFHERYKRLTSAAAATGLPFIKLDSNLHSFYEKRLNFELTNTIRNIAAVSILKNRIGTHLYSSSYGFRHFEIHGTRNMAHFDVLSFAYLSSPGMRFLSSGAHLNRVQKSCRVSGYAPSHDSLNVCVSSAHNCSACSKCLRTMLTFEIAGHLARYAGVFDLTVFRKKRTRYLSYVIVSNEYFCREIKEFAKQNGFRFPLVSYLLIPFTAKSFKELPPIRFFRNFARKILN